MASAEIVAVGTELLLGEIVNTNAQYLSQELARLGISVHFQTVVGDNPGRLRGALQRAIERSDIVITTGGLGPTADDLTKETVCELFGLPLVEDAEAKQHLIARFRMFQKDAEITENNYKQILFPREGIILKNNNGTAPGMALRQGGKLVVTLPGPPFEMKAMYQESVKPLLLEYSDSTIYSRSIEFFGIGESALEARLRPLLDSENPTVAPYAKDGQCRIRVTAKAHTVEEADALIAPMIERIRAIAGSFIYSTSGESLEESAVAALERAGLTVAVAESCTGGRLGARIASVPGVSSCFLGGFLTYSDQLKINLLGVDRATLLRKSAVSADVAAKMAIGARKNTGADLGVSITGEAGPVPATDNPVGTVYVALADRDHVYVKRLDLARFAAMRDRVTLLSSNHALDMLRLYCVDRDSLAAACIPERDLDLGQHRFFELAARYVLPLRGDSSTARAGKIATNLCLAAFLCSTALLALPHLPDSAAAGLVIPSDLLSADLSSLIASPPGSSLGLSGSGSSAGESSGALSSRSPSSGASSSSKSASSKAASSKAASSAPASSAASPSSSSAASSAPVPAGDETLTIIKGGAAVTLPAIDVLSEVVAAEMGKSMHPEALRAQAVASYTYLKRQNVTGATPAPVLKADDGTIRAIIAPVVGKTITYGGALAYTPYHAIAAGATNSALEVWNTSYPYLVSVPSLHDSGAAGYAGTLTLTEAQVRAAVAAAVPAADLSGDPAGWFVVLDHTSGGYNGNMSVGGATKYYNALYGRDMPINGRWVREDILSAARTGAGKALRSAKFTVSYAAGVFTFTTEGYGHGVGMSQVGANGYAQNEGWDYRAILLHYYPGTTIS